MQILAQSVCLVFLYIKTSVGIKLKASLEEHFQLFLLMVRKKLDCAKESVKNVKQYQSASSALLDISITKENVVYVILNAKHA